jgi:signal-transduction protein with cAMP-binding, CBS, and nucleotidyltransferase domain
MPYERELTDEELDQLLSEALDQLADAVRELNTANTLYAQRKPKAELATRRRSLARETLKYSLHTYHALRDQIERRYRGADPVGGTT